MHALVGVWTLGQGRAGDADGIVPRPPIEQLPGLVETFWAADAETGKMHSFDVFSDEQGARRLKGMIETCSQVQARAGLSYDRLSIVEVKAWTSREAAS